MDLNRVFLIGNMTQDPRISTTPTGRTVASFGIATNRNWTSADGLKQSEAEFHNVVAWGKLAEIVSQYCKKGKKIFVEGRLQTREWKAQDGSSRRTTEIVASNVIMLSRDQQSPGNFQQNQDRNNQNFAPNQGQNQVNNSGYNAPEIDDSIDEISIDDIPI